MKLKTILTFAFAASFAAGVISCEDMLKVPSKTVELADEFGLDTPSDTVYSVLGVIKQMQKIADRSLSGRIMSLKKSYPIRYSL